MNVPRHDFTETVGNTNERFVNIGGIQAAGVKQAAMRRPLETFFDCITFHNHVSPNLLNKANQIHKNFILTAEEARIKKNQPVNRMYKIHFAHTEKTF
jgi:hypothetical protein